MSSTAIVWLRRDFRLSDNSALKHASNVAQRIIPLYIHALDEEAPWQIGGASRWWLQKSLARMDAELRKAGSRLIIRRGSSCQILQDVARREGVELIFWNRLYEPSTAALEKRIESIFAGLPTKLQSCRGSLLREPWEIKKNDGGMYRVFTPYSRNYLHRVAEEPEDKPVKSLPPVPKHIESLSVGELGLAPAMAWHQPLDGIWRPGEIGAQAALNEFIEQSAVDTYQTRRDIPSVDGVSMLSAHLHFGEISSRQAWNAVLRARPAKTTNPHDDRQNGQAYLRQLVWRDFAHHVLHHLPHTPQQPFNDRFRNFQWEENPKLLKAWKRGQTGIPLVDAGMRQLWHIGWMHNRVRMVAASMLAKNGLVDWLEGARWFWDTLVDADLANNTMGWQWVAGCGVDAAPYFRIFSPARQGERFDPNGDYVRRWVPELALMPAKHIHEPWRAPDSVLSQAGIRLGRDYPRPIIDLNRGRLEALRRFNALG